MSTKIYTAYRLRKSSDLWPFVRDTRRKALQRLHVRLQEAFKVMALEVSKSPEYQQKVRDGDLSESTLHFMTERALTQRYREQSIKSEKDPFDFDIWITIREYRRKLYLLPSCGMGAHGCLDFLKRDKRLEDFAYWNSSDKPRHISQEDWDTRGVVWDALDSGPTVRGQLHTDAWSDYLVLDISSYTGFYKAKPRFTL
jgi:hypothetical protein